MRGETPEAAVEPRSDVHRLRRGPPRPPGRRDRAPPTRVGVVRDGTDSDTESRTLPEGAGWRYLRVLPSAGPPGRRERRR